MDAAADRMARSLLNMAVDENVSDAAKLAAIRDALDRSIGRAPTTVDIGVGVKRPFEQIESELRVVPVKIVADPQGDKMIRL